jgi:hypothetical protein
MKLLVSLHDVTPFHAARLALAERVLADLAIRRMTYLLVPRFHGLWDVCGDEAFRRWCRAARPFEVEWALHGFEHREPAGAKPPSGLAARLKRRYLTAGEGEFLALDEGEAAERLERGRAAFHDCLGREPQAFVAPAWLFRPDLLPQLRGAGFQITEDHRYLYDLTRGRRLDCPVITWATRSLVRRVGSRVVNRALARRWQDVPLLRIALHPFDFTEPETVRAIVGALRTALADREPVLAGNVVAA